MRMQAFNEMGTRKHNREANKGNCPDCGKYFCMCKCRICGNTECTCACYTCDTVPFVCKRHQCRSDPSVCPCIDCIKYPCVCVCTECSQSLTNCSCMEANDNGSEVIIQKSPGENHADDEDTKTVVKSFVSENVHDNDSLVNENFTEDEAKQDTATKIQSDGSDKTGKQKAQKWFKEEAGISKDGINDNEDHRTDSSIEKDIIKNESLVAGTNRELSEGKQFKRNDDSTPSYDIVVGGSGEINKVDMEDSLSMNEIVCTPVCDEVITTEGAKENIELFVCSGDGSESSVEILDTNSGGDVINDEGNFISAKQAPKLKKERAKAGKEIKN
ncbi:unnamed protein product [Mytilus coruscus]|uniref:Uncharacterized protein n=1 Tax=Mytilus coruscus TaxID=42192 RepID=A0A6J8ESB4_MYTCO|nr:unnamed protein product [Mytilus coruscus]